MGTEVESPNSNHHVSQIISDSFLFLEGEEDGGGATNGNQPVSGAVSGAGGGPEGTAAVVGASQSPGSPVKQDPASANGNSSPATYSANTSYHEATSTPNTLTGQQDGTEKDNVLGELQSPCKDTMIGKCFSVESTSVGNVTGGSVSVGCSGDGSRDNNVSGLSDSVQDQGSTGGSSSDQASAGGCGDTDGVSIKVNSHSTCDKSPSDAACSGGCDGQSEGSLPTSQQTLDKESHPVHISSSQNTHRQHNAAGTRTTSASTSDTTEEAYEVRLREQARFIVGKVLNCNSLREALKKTKSWQKNRRLAWRDSSSTHSGDFSFSHSASCGAGRFSNRHSDSQIHTGTDSIKINSASHRPHSEVWSGLESQTKTSEHTQSAVAESQQSKTREEKLAEDYVPTGLFDDQSADTTCSVAASAAVKLRRKKSEVGSKPVMGERGSSDSPSSSPGQSPGPTKRQLLRSPVLRIKQEWNSVDITSDSDSSPRQSEDSDDDDDGGIYAESYRNSQWLYIGGTPGASTENLDDSTSVFDTSIGDGDVTTEDGDVAVTSQKETLTLSVDSGLGQSESSPRLYKQRARDDDLPPTLPRRPRHHRSESISTTASEIEFRKRYQAKTKRIVQRKSSTHTYQRMSERFYDEERSVVIEKGPSDSTFGFHIKGHHPVMVSTVETNSAAEVAGVKVGDAVIAVNDVNIMDVSHQEAIRLIGQDTNRVKLMLATDQRVLSDVPLCSGFLIKQGGSGILKNWRRRWFLLKQDHCLYYYKTEEDKDPLGAIMLTNYTVTKAPEANRKHTFKAHKYGQRTYYFQAESEDDMNRWASALSNAAKATTKTDTWLDVSSHNVGLPALSIKSPDCHGHLTKMGNRRKNWKRRYCVLKDACLYYYIDLTSSTAQGVAHLHGYTVEENLPFNKKFGFTLIPPDVSMRTFYFCADNETDMKRWIKALQKSIGRWIREEDE